MKNHGDKQQSWDHNHREIIVIHVAKTMSLLLHMTGKVIIPTIHVIIWGMVYDIVLPTLMVAFTKKITNNNGDNS